jgi:sec-independent protein translocase protein TatC
MTKRSAEHHTMSFGDHLEELRKRLLAAIFGVLPIFGVASFFGATLLEFLTIPVRSRLMAAGLPDTLQTTAPMEAFNTYFKIAFIVTLIVGVPWIIYQLWRFIAPGLYTHEKRFVRILLPMSVVLSITGVAFLYKVILPIALSFLIGFGADLGKRPPGHAELPQGVTLPVVPVLDGDPPKPPVGAEWYNSHLRQRRICERYEGEKPIVSGIQYTSGAGIVPQYKLSEYINFVLMLALAFAAGFQMPVVVLLLGWVGIVDRVILAKYRKHAVLVSAFGAIALTPGDPLSMLLLAVPLYLLYELGGLLLKWLPAHKVAEGFGAKKPVSEEEAEANTARDIEEEEAARR